MALRSSACWYSMPRHAAYAYGCLNASSTLASGSRASSNRSSVLSQTTSATVLVCSAQRSVTVDAGIVAAGEFDSSAPPLLLIVEATHVSKQRGAKVAQIDLARRLSEAIWHMLSRGERFAPKGATDPLAA
jgi:hypothetical protein